MQEEFIAYANSEGLDGHMHLRTLSRAFAVNTNIQFNSCNWGKYMHAF